MAPVHAPIPTLGGVEHVSMTVPDLDEATAFFTDVFGCRVLYTMGPFSGERANGAGAGQRGAFMRRYANADVRAIVHYVRVLRSPFLNIELFSATYPGQRTLWPDFLDIGGWHLAGYVDDMDAAVEYIERTDIYVLGQGKRATGGPEVGDGSFALHCMTPWGFRFELLTYPNGRAYQDAYDGRLWNPAQPDRGARQGYQPAPSAVPGFRGFEHLSMAVPDLDDASELLVGVLGCEAFYDLNPAVDNHSSEFGAYANVDVRARPSGVRLFRSPYLNIEV